MVGSLVATTATAIKNDESSMSAISAVTSATPWVSRNGLNSRLTTIALLLTGSPLALACPTSAPQSVQSGDPTTTKKQDTCQPLLGRKIERLASARVPSLTVRRSP